MKKRNLLVSIMTLVLCLTLISGATFALFTSESKVDITVSSGKVSVESVIENLQLYSLDEEQSEKFENGGTAVYKDGVLSLTNVTPGDKVTFKVKITNDSNIDIKYKLTWSVKGKLSEVLIATADDEKLSNLPWTLWKADALEKTIVIDVVVELPLEVGNDYQEKSCDIVFLVEAIQSNGILNNYATPSTIKDALANAEEGSEIELAAGYYDEIIVPKNGMKIFSNADAVVGFLNVNGKENVTIKGLTFEATGAGLVYDYTDSAKARANIAGASGKNTVGARKLLIEDCTFTGEFEKAGVCIAFCDQKRPSGFSGDITISNCTFETVNANYCVYGFYLGSNGLSFTFENNTVNNICNAGPVYLGRYASSVPVVIKGNAFNTTSSLSDSAHVQDHSNYGVSIDASNNTFK